MYKKVRISRAKIVVLITKKPSAIFINYALRAYWKIRCINVIIAYESDKKIQVITYDPYLPELEKIVNLTNSTQDLFYDKTKDLHRTKIKCLLTYRDRTKVKRVEKNDGVHYEGKDYAAINTILTHLNGELQMETMDNIILNPWFESIYFGNQSGRMMKILNQRDISILIKSERFTVDNEIFDNLYPHTQNDLSSLVPKSTEIPMENSMLMVYTPSMWIACIVTPIRKCLNI
jgi:hypothetical protein